MVPRPLAPARAMRCRTCADVIQPCPSQVPQTPVILFVYHLPKKFGNFGSNVNGRLILSPRTEVFLREREFFCTVDQNFQKRNFHLPTILVTSVGTAHGR